MNDSLTDGLKSADTWRTYQSAWQDIPDRERARRLQASMTEDCRYLDPDYETHGYDELAVIIASFMTATPGATFTNYRFLEHHGQAIANWRLDIPGLPPINGASHATFANDGRLQTVTGFFNLPS